MFTEIRSKRGLGYDVGTQVMSDNNFGYFAAYAIIDKKNIALVTDLMLEEIRRLNNVTLEEVKEAQDFIEGDYLLEIEDTQKVADQILFWEQVKDAKKMSEFITKIKKVGKSDIRRVMDRYFKYHTFVVVEGK